jgi:hypothetical protein
MKTTTRRCARKVSEALVWYHFLPVHSEQGELWYQTFHTSGAEQIGYDVDVLVARMQDRSCNCLEAVAQDLAAVRESILALGRSVPASMRGVMEEAYRGVLAYQYYRQGFLERADRELELALAAVDEALRSDQILLTFSLKNLQLITNRARVARDRRDWARMEGLLETCRQMIADRVPLHQGGASAIYFRDVCSFYQGIEPADAIDAQALEILARPESLALSFRKAIGSVCNALHVANDW